jgi:hypothetical protein
MNKLPHIQPGAYCRTPELIKATFGGVSHRRRAAGTRSATAGHIRRSRHASIRADSMASFRGVIGDVGPYEYLFRRKSHIATA